MRPRKLPLRFPLSESPDMSGRETRVPVPEALPIEGVECWSLVATRFALDGGAMFGVVPRVRWEKVWRPDAFHRVPLVARVVVVRDRARGLLAVVDVGLGRRWSDRDRERFAITDDDGLRLGLAALGHSADEVTDVVLTHLHWDHAGGVREPGGALAFPRATHHVARAHLADARRASAKDRGSFFGEDIDALERSGLLRIHARYGRWLPGISTSRSDGHAEGLAVTSVGRGPRAVFPVDLVPAVPHMRPSWVMAYDNAPRRTAVEKTALLEALAGTDDWLVLAHDPDHAAVRVTSTSGEGSAPFGVLRSPESTR